MENEKPSLVPSDASRRELRALVAQFGENHNEDRVRSEFIDKFFRLLGWDMGNDTGAGEVIRQDDVKVFGRTKKPDYGFYIGNSLKFFLEAKKPAVDIKGGTDPAEQIRSYGWNKKLPISILTDFEEFSVYNTRIKPKASKTKKEAAAIARERYYTFREYEEKFDEIYALCSREAVAGGSLDTYAEKTKGTDEVDDDLLRQIEEWRELLAKNIYKLNTGLSVFDLNTVVQKIIDRLIFLRFAEDRGSERENLLLEASGAPDVYAELKKIFAQANTKYNAGLFAKDTFIDNARIDDGVLTKIIENLYYPQSPYLFDVLPIEILGSIYERFLGKTIRLTEKRIKIEEKPEVKKAGGVYYTPQYIVDYIVQNTVREKIKGKTPEEIAKIKICDPACGSGSFLIGAYQYLLDYHLAYYTQAKNVQAALNNKRIYAASGKPPTYKLTIAEKQRILTSSIFGVDIDAQAVEVSKLSLYLKLLEGETQEAEEQNRFAHSSMALLPSLEENIKCGNSLIGTDYYDSERDLLNDARMDMNCFDWKTKFPNIFNTEKRPSVGFDVVLGNPPYVEFKQLDAGIKVYLEKKYQSANGKYDLYIPFIEKSVRLLNTDGISSFIVPSMFTKRDYGKSIRKYITQNMAIQAMTYFGDFQVFNGVTVFPFIFVFRKAKINATKITLFSTQKGLTHENVAKSLNSGISDSISLKYFINTDSFGEGSWTITDKTISGLQKKIENTPNAAQLKDITEYIFVGIQSGKDEVFYIDEEIRAEYGIEKEILFPIYKGRDIQKYRAKWGGTYCIYPYDITNNKVIPEKEFKSKYPNTYKYLTERKELLQGRDYFDNSSKLWYELWCERIYSKFHQTKIVNAEISDNNRFYLDEEYYLGNTKVFSTVLNKEWRDHYLYVLGILNSRVLEFFHKQISVPKAGGFFEYKTQFLNVYPIRVIDFNKSDEAKSYETITHCANQLLQLYKQLQAENLPGKTAPLKNKISYCENRINEAVYALYGLTEEEIKIVEGR
ncbi:MAG: N-6 DNA methylase [Spirochaetota bacterium]|jgi:adenine-specific DNA-methyltransferase|nr:N-6 DNA methylase [Spirochaetota bacterium]